MSASRAFRIEAAGAHASRRCRPIGPIWKTTLSGGGGEADRPLLLAAVEVPHLSLVRRDALRRAVPPLRGHGFLPELGGLVDVRIGVQDRVVDAGDVGEEVVVGHGESSTSLHDTGGGRRRARGPGRAYPPPLRPSPGEPAMSRQILVTAALPYVNDHLHIGHLVGYIQADVWVRFQRMRGHQVRYFCADDTHGTATMIRAQERGTRARGDPRRDERRRIRSDFAAFAGGVRPLWLAPTARATSALVGGHLGGPCARPGSVAERNVSQLYDADRRASSSRIVSSRGICPKLRCARIRYGDNCEVCGSIYSPGRAGGCRRAQSRERRPEVRTAPHFFVHPGGRSRPFWSEWTQTPGAACSRRSPIS